MDVIVIATQEKSGQIRTHTGILMKIHTQLEKQQPNKKVGNKRIKKRKRNRGRKEEKKRGRKKKSTKKRKGKKEKRKRGGNGCKGVEEHGYSGR